MTCPHCNNTGYAQVPGGFAPCTACATGQVIGKGPAGKRKPRAGQKQQETGKRRANWKQWDKTLERMGAK